jgi:hypothetical protein
MRAHLGPASSPSTPVPHCTPRSRTTIGEWPCHRAHEVGCPIWCGGGALAAPVSDPPLATAQGGRGQEGAALAGPPDLPHNVGIRLTATTKVTEEPDLREEHRHRHGAALAPTPTEDASHRLESPRAQLL